MTEVSMSKVSLHQIRIFEIRMAEVSIAKVSASEVKIAKVSAAEIGNDIQMYFSPLIPHIHTLFENIKMLWVCHCFLLDLLPFCSGVTHFSKNRCVNVAIKLISMSSPTTASKAASTTRGS